MPDILIVGSVPLADSEAVFRSIAVALGDRVRRMPDGETGPRINWIEFQTPVFDRHPLFESAPEDRGAKADWRNAAADTAWKIKSWHRLKPGATGADVSFGPLGYAEAAKQSYAVFARLKREGVVPRGCRFQVSLPTPYNVIDQRIAPEDRLAVEKPYEARMLAEDRRDRGGDAAGELAIQWDTAHEIQNLDGGRPHWFDDPETGIVERLARLGEAVPAGVELGYHLCYGDFNHRHFIEPKDAGTLVRVANALSPAGRPRHRLHPHAGAARPDRRRLFRAAPRPGAQARLHALSRPGALHRRRRRHARARRRGAEGRPASSASRPNAASAAGRPRPCRRCSASTPRSRTA